MGQSLLTDPRITDDEYLFFNDNPFSRPPNNDNTVIGDINTGEAYRKSYNKYITKPGKQVLLPFIFYCDGTATGQFADLPITPFKFTLGIFKRKARAKSDQHLWRTMGYVPVISKQKSRGKRKFQESGHVDSTMKQLSHGEGNVGGSTVVAAQDYHEILKTLLEDYQKIQQEKGGFLWTLFYKGKEVEVEFVPYVHMVKVDTEEADKLCGKYLTRTKNVAQLCRYCCCPTSESDRLLADYPCISALSC